MASPEEIRSLNVILTAGCNLACGYCYENDKKRRQMDWETLRASVDLLLRSERAQVQLTFYGGEPLMEFETIRRAVAYAEEKRPAEKRIHYAIITNGTLLDDETADFLAHHRFETRLSFDGVPAAQDLRGRGTFKVLDGVLDRLKARHPEFFRDNLSITITLVIAVLAHLHESVDYFLRKGVHEVAITPVETQEALWKAGMIEDLDRQFARVFRASLLHYRRTGEVPLQIFRKKQAASVHRPQGRSMCGAPRGENLAVDVDGRTYGCATFAGSYQKFPSDFLKTRLEKMELGNLRETGFRGRLAMYPEAAREARIFDAKQEKRSSYGRCRDCRFLASCAVCPVSIGHIPGNTDPDRVPDFLCAFNLVTLKYREMFPRQDGPAEILAGRARIPLLTRELVASMGSGRSGRSKRMNASRDDLRRS